MDLNSLSKYTRADKSKAKLIDDVLSMQMRICAPKMKHQFFAYLADDDSDNDACYEVIHQTKFCPECGKKYPESENFCLECGVILKQIKYVDVKEIEIKPEFAVVKANEYHDFKDILTDENIEKIAKGDFSINRIKKNIKIEALKRLDDAIKQNDILFDDLTPLEKVTLFVKSFVHIEYKSYGPELGFYEFNKISIDDRQLDVLQITTLLHELAHFLNKEILVHIICELLDCSKTSEIESIATFILSYYPPNQLIDEYAAHTVEGRFTLYGYQDYSSFLSIQKTIDLPADDIEMLKTIGNSFANIIKSIIESFIDSRLLDDIKAQFRREILDRPDYRNLAMENCTLLYSEGFIKAVKWILSDGFMVAIDNIDILNQYNSKI